MQNYQLDYASLRIVYLNQVPVVLGYRMLLIAAPPLSSLLASLLFAQTFFKNACMQCNKMSHCLNSSNRAWSLIWEVRDSRNTVEAEPSILSRTVSLLASALSYHRADNLLDNSHDSKSVLSIVTPANNPVRVLLARNGCKALLLIAIDGEGACDIGATDGASDYEVVVALSGWAVCYALAPSPGTGNATLTPDELLNSPCSQMVSRLNLIRLWFRLSLSLCLTLELSPNQLLCNMIRLHNLIIHHLTRTIPKEGILSRRRIDRHNNPKVSRLIIANIDEHRGIRSTLEIRRRGEAGASNSWSRLGRFDVVVEVAGDGGAGAGDDGEGVAADVAGVVAGADELFEGPGWVSANVEGGGGGGGEAEEGEEGGGDAHFEVAEVRIVFGA